MAKQFSVDLVQGFIEFGGVAVASLKVEFGLLDHLNWAGGLVIFMVVAGGIAAVQRSSRPTGWKKRGASYPGRSACSWRSWPV